MNIEAYRPDHLPAVVRFWNRCFSNRRNFFPVTEEIFRDRILEKRTEHQRFEPEGFLIAVEGGEVVGIIHAGVRSEEVCRSLDARWPGGSQGVIYLIQVDPAYTRRGFGTLLWHRALEFLKSTRQVTLDGQCLNPFYGNAEGPVTPFWGTPVGLAVDWKDGPTQKFLARKGFAPRVKAVQVALDIPASSAPPLADSENALREEGLGIRYDSKRLIQVGDPEDAGSVAQGGLDFECISLVREKVTVGVLVYYPLSEVDAGLFGIYEAKVAKPYRGKTMGRHLLAAATARMRDRQGRSAEVLTIPELFPEAAQAFEAAGFQPVARWAVY